MIIGLVLIRDENDVLERTLAANVEFVDAFYVLDGTEPNDESRAICERHEKCGGYVTDADLPESYPRPIRDGCRQHLYELASVDHGRDHWFLLMHGDEVLTGLPPLDDTAHDGFVFRLPFYFPRAGEPWRPGIHPLDQLRWHLGPGYPEFRLFHGGTDVNWEPIQHHNVVPSGLQRLGDAGAPIKHFLYRGPDEQRARAADRTATGFDEANYRHIIERDAVAWTDEMIAEYQRHSFFTDLNFEEG